MNLILKIAFTMIVVGFLGWMFCNTYDYEKTEGFFFLILFVGLAIGIVWALSLLWSL